MEDQKITFDSEKAGVTVTLRYETALHLYSSAVLTGKLLTYDPEDQPAIDSSMAEALSKIQEASDKMTGILVSATVALPIEDISASRCSICNSPEINSLAGEEPRCALHEQGVTI